MTGSSPSHPPASLPTLSRWPAVSVVVPARDCADTLPRAVDSVLDQRFDGSLEVVLAVAPSTDATEGVAARLAHEDPRIRYRVNRAATTPAGLNLAVDTARGDVIVRLDAHGQLPPGYIERVLDLLRETGAANVGGMQVPTGRTGTERAIAAAMTSRLGSGGPRYRVGGPPGDVETVYLGCYRREALEAVGGFDEELLRNQDYELNHRLRERGFRVYFHPDLRVHYQPRGSFRDLWRQYFDYGRWKRHVLRLHPGSLRLRQLAPPALLLALVAAALLSVASAGPWPLVGVGGVYLLGLALGVTVEVGRGAAMGVRLVPLIVVALAVMHLAWGVGFVVGRRRPPVTPPGADDLDRDPP